jgi:hypothetical protein
MKHAFIFNFALPSKYYKFLKGKQLYCCQNSIQCGLTSRFFMFGKLSFNKGCEVSHPMNYKLCVYVLLVWALLISIMSNVNLVVLDKFACYNKCLFLHLTIALNQNCNIDCHNTKSSNQICVGSLYENSNNGRFGSFAFLLPRMLQDV